MPKTTFFSIAGIFCLLFFFYIWQLPESKPIEIPSLAPKQKILLVPLDSRPVCTNLPQKLAALAGIKLIVPPNDLLDNYRQPANTEKIQHWLNNNLANTQTAIVSTDMLLAGGLIQARKQASTVNNQQALEQFIKELQAKNMQLQLFQVIPRLLVSDELIPDRWYKYKLLQYSQLYDIAEIFNDFQSTKQLQDLKNRIPDDVLAKYFQLYTSQNQLNKKLIALTNKETSLVIGQDDGEPFGLHHRCALWAEKNIKKAEKNPEQATLSYGADELASVLIARTYLKQSKYTPKVYIQYADTSIPNLIMPYLPITIAGVLKEKLALLHMEETSLKEQADFILYVNCGSDEYKPTKEQALELNKLINNYPHVALLDLSANFEQSELLLPQALKINIPLNRLCAYAGWNTFSNSAGTVLAQAAIFTGRLKDLSNSEQKLQLYTTNFAFNIERFLDDFIYQKKLHANLKKELLTRGIEPTELNAHDHNYAQALAQFFLQNQALMLLHTNLGLNPYYITPAKKFYLKDIKIKAQLPWNRIFEINIDIYPIWGFSENK